MKKLCAVVCLALVFGSCAGAPATENKPGPCLMNNEMSAKITMDHEGTTVGFCCTKCQDKFKELSAEDKAKKIAAAALKN